MRFTRYVSRLWQTSSDPNNLSTTSILQRPKVNDLRLHLFAPIVVLLLTTILFGTQKEVTVNVDGTAIILKTPFDNVGSILQDARIPVESGDSVSPPLYSSISNNRSIVIYRAQPVVVFADGERYGFRTLSRSLTEIVKEAGVELRQEDSVHLGNKNTPRVASAPSLRPATISISPSAMGNSLARALPMSSRSGSRELTGPIVGTEPMEIIVERSFPIFVQDGEIVFEIYSTRRTVGEALADHGLTIYEHDIVFPLPETGVTANTHVRLLRAKPLTIEVDGRTIRTRTQAKTIEDAILQEGVKLVGKDRIEPPRNATVESNINVHVIRVKEDIITEQETIAFITEHRADPTLEIDLQQVTENGTYGVQKWETRIVYENGEEISRTELRRWVDSPAVNRVISWGTKIVTREVQTPDGVQTYWRKFRMWATSYNASHGGKSPDNPAYGVTRSGLMVTKGIVAVDPNYIPLYTHLYVPGYGTSLAADTGGAVKGMIIDLGFDEGVTDGWSARWVDVYWLTPAPPASQIDFRLFN
ncbi:MAG: ubiquitin-like domain-containing protein [Dehalococcoidia bacterium]|nr:ubiquitin-like domain-containing protein [Dehalococcoidia bacterium]